MIQLNTLMYVADNSGAKKVKCIKVLGGFKRKTAYTGDIVVVSIKKLRSINRHRSKVSKGDVVRALIIRTKTKIKKKDGSFFHQNKNTAILINKKGNLIGTRILTSLPKHLKKKKYLKYFSLCPGTV